MKNEKLLYIHIPFCDSKCNYCAFNSYTNINHLKKEYFKALKTQFLHDVTSDTCFETVFIGGGTPSVMNVSFYENLFELISPHLKNTREITIECNPNTSFEWLREIKNLGVNRISFGVQSFNEKKLKFLNRNHSSKQALKSVENAKKAGFENINLDLIYSTALDTKELLKSDLQTAFSLPVNHISAYSLTIEENTKWEGDFSKRKQDEELEIWFINKIKEKFTQYEISNFGKPCQHNLGYWTGKEYIGTGAGAVGFKKWRMENGEWKMERYYTKQNVYEYIKNPNEYKCEYLTDEDIKKEKVFLGLRSTVGFEENILNKEEKKRIEILLSENRVLKKENKIYSHDFLLADAITSYILN
jgi:oxygen-independent coproporphyrinogen-3 oxidase